MELSFTEADFSDWQEANIKKFANQSTYELMQLIESDHDCRHNPYEVEYCSACEPAMHEVNRRLGHQFYPFL